MSRQIKRRAFKAQPESRKEAELRAALDDQVPSGIGFDLFLGHVEQRLLVDEHGHQQHRDHDQSDQPTHNPQYHQHLGFPSFLSFSQHIRGRARRKGLSWAATLDVLIQNAGLFAAHAGVGFEFPQCIFGELIRYFQVDDGIRVVHRV